MYKTILFFIISFSLFSCALSKAIYLGPDNYSQRTSSPYPSETYHAENINGIFPEAVYIKTKTQTFNLYHYYILHDGLIWYKSIDTDKEPSKWMLFARTGLPRNVGAIAEISADADELIALSAEGNFYRYCFDITIAHRSNTWLDRQGWPVGEQLYFDSRTANNLAWALGKRNSHVRYHEDIFGNQHHYGTMEIATTYVLLEDGQEICYGDPGLPSDFSRNFVGPERGTFIAASLSASASTMFVINEAGEMYTRLVDFDTSGDNPMTFDYTYIPYKSDLSGTSYFSHQLSKHGLPSEDWRSQPRIPLIGEAAITRHITILQNGQGNASRELRVAGLNEEGKTGYWNKQIFDTEWEFTAVPLYFAENAILVTADTFDANTQGKRGQSLDKSYSGFKWKDNEKEYGWEYQIPNFNILEGDCDFIVTWNGETCTLTLHPVEMWTYLKRDYLPGRNGSPKIFLVTLEIPEKAFESLSDTFVRLLKEKYSKHDKSIFQYTIAATHNYIILRDTGDTDSLLFLTDGSISNQYSKLLTTRYVENYEEVQRYYSPELTLDTNTAFTVEDLTEKIALNRQFVNELKYKIRVLRWSGLTAFKVNAGYLPSHYISKMTSLGFFPKIRIVTSFGEKIVLANNAFLETTSNTRIWLYEKIIAMLEARMRYYSDLIKELPSFSIDDPNGIFLPPWYSDSISDYWDIAGLPHNISGTFFNPATRDQSLQIPAVLSIVPSTYPTKHDISGWYFAIGGSGNFSIFIDPRNSVKTIYSRKGTRPQEKKLQLDCTLYINDGAIAPIERNIIERCLRPFIIGTNENIDIRITFDGKTFEIREYPAKHSETLIFRGSL